jgi:hypothetical protein
MENPRPDAENRPDLAGGQSPGDLAEPGFLPTTPPRANVESIAVRCIATAGVVGIGTAIGAILESASVAGWIMGLVVSLVSVVLAALLWRSRRL